MLVRHRWPSCRLVVVVVQLVIILVLSIVFIDDAASQMTVSEMRKRKADAKKAVSDVRGKCARQAAGCRCHRRRRRRSFFFLTMGWWGWWCCYRDT